MYLFNRRYGLFENYSHVWALCHCPVDKIIRNIVVEKVKELQIDINISMLSEITWNFITEEAYMYFQSVVSEICVKEGIHSKMFFDILYWERPKKKKTAKTAS